MLEEHVFIAEVAFGLLFVLKSKTIFSASRTIKEHPDGAFRLDTSIAVQSFNPMSAAAFSQVAMSLTTNLPFTESQFPCSTLENLHAASFTATPSLCSHCVFLRILLQLLLDR